MACVVLAAVNAAVMTNSRLTSGGTLLLPNVAPNMTKRTLWGIVLMRASLTQ